MPLDLDSRTADSIFESAFTFASIGMALVGTDGRWLSVNRSLCDIIGYSEGELLERTFQDVTHPDDLDLDLENVRRMLSGEIDTYQMEKRYVRKDKSILWALLSVSLVRDAEAAPLFFVSQIQDITQRKESEHELIQAAAEIEKLRGGLLTVCAWTKQIQIEGQWIPVDEFLSKHLQLRLTHGMSEEGAKMFEGKYPSSAETPAE